MASSADSEFWRCVQTWPHPYNNFVLQCVGTFVLHVVRAFEHASAHIRNYRDVNFFHWSEASFRRYWSTARPPSSPADMETPTADMHTTIQFSSTEPRCSGIRPWAAWARARVMTA